MEIHIKNSNVLPIFKDKGMSLGTDGDTPEISGIGTRGNGGHNIGGSPHPPTPPNI